MVVKKSLKTQKKASEQYDIPRTTLKRKVCGTHTLNYGGQKVLNEIEETNLCEGLLLCSKWGFPMIRKDLRLLIKSYLDKIGRSEKRFKNNLPGIEFLIENVSPCSIVNYDETNFTDDPKKQKIIAKRGSKHPENILDSSKTSISVMMSGNAVGELLPPYIVYKADNLYPTWTENGPQGSRYNRSKSGWFDERIFDDWFHSLALPFLKKKPSPRVLIGDNLSSHVSISVINTCIEHDIKFILLPPNTTHICQPLDVAFFGPLKKKWREVLLTWKISNRGVVPKSEFPTLLKSTIDSLQSKSTNLIAGFSACGICPLDRLKVLKKLPDSESSLESSTISWSSSIIETLKAIRCPEQREGICVRGKKLNIEPGNGVEDEESDNTSIDSPDSISDLSSSEETNSEIESLSPTASKDNNITSLPNNETVYLVNEFIVARFESKKRGLLYVAKILNVNEKTLHVSCMRKIIGKNKIYFSFPNIADECEIDYKDVVCNIYEPVDLRRNRFVFPNLNLDYDLLN
eukprot:XP_016657726.1 PREDICTED: uncharacterized protein LOC107882980 [Acyrthosiphon pisum]